MLMSIQSIIDQIKDVKLKIESGGVLLKDKKEILDYVRYGQLFEKGEDADGNKLKPYTPFTRSVKSAEGRDPNIVTLFDTGDFYESFDLSIIDGSVINIFATDPKTNDLIEKYGSRILDLSDENEEKTQENIDVEIDELISNIKI